MYPDQASDLRRMTQRPSLVTATSVGTAPRLMTVVGARAGVGVSTMAIGLSLSLVDSGFRVVLVDTSTTGALTNMCAIPFQKMVPPRRLRDIHESLVRGPSGLQLVPSLDAFLPSADPPIRIRTLHEEIRRLGKHADFVIIDAGRLDAYPVESTPGLSNELLFVTTIEERSILEGYLALKKAISPEWQGIVQTIFNRASDPTSAREAFRRMDASCQRFLSRRLAFEGRLTEEDSRHPSNLPEWLKPRSGSRVASELSDLATRLATKHESSATRAA